MTESWFDPSDMSVYYSEMQFVIRPLRADDIATLVEQFAFPWSTPEKTVALWEGYYREQQEGVRTVGIIEQNKGIAGYGSLLRKSENPYFASLNIPEVNAIWIDDRFRRKGLGTTLIKWLEDLALKEGYHQIGIGVGLYADYGPAQQLYFRLGYVPDGRGVTYKGVQAVAGESYPLDDEFLLWFTKRLIK